MAGSRDGSNWSRSELAPWASRRRRDLLELLDRLSPTIAELTQAIEQEVGEMSRGAAAGDASRGRSADGAGFRADHRHSGAVSAVASKSRAIWDWCR